VADNERKVAESVGRVEAAEKHAEGEFIRLKEEKDIATRLFSEKVVAKYFAVKRVVI
jgi:hypothetical protein